ncbi:MAG: hypothetical protein ACFFDQ_08790 [Candidatus Thorarchaeota archaeon]
MDKKKLALIVGCIVLSGLLIDLVVLFPWERPELSWAINIDDEFVFNATFSGYVEYPENTTYGQTVLSRLANTTIIAKIASLPTPNILTTDDFLTLTSTTIVTSRFSNGSDIPTDVSTELNRLVSKLFIPTGAWKYLDSLFPDNATDAGQHEFWCDTYFTRLYETSFIFGHRRYLSDSGSWWHGVVSCSNGVPQLIVSSSMSYVPPYVAYSWTFHLELVDD